MKCIVCDKDTDFLVKGDSLCEIHMPKDVKEERVNFKNEERGKKFGMK